MCEEVLFTTKLPDALSKEETYNLLERVQLGDISAREKIIVHNIKLVFLIVFKTFNDLDYDKSDLISIGNIGLIRAVDTFDINKGYEFTSYATKCIENEILLFLRKKKKELKTASLYYEINCDENSENIRLVDVLRDKTNIEREYEKKEITAIIMELIKELPKREREIIYMYFGFYNGRVYTQKEIAEKFNLSRTTIATIIIRTIKKIKIRLTSLGILEEKNTLKF